MSVGDQHEDGGGTATLLLHLLGRLAPGSGTAAALLCQYDLCL